MRKILQTLVDAIRGTETDLTQGSINRAIVLLSVPMIIEMLGEGLFAVVDAYFVNMISNEAFATVILTENVATIIYSLGIGISIAASAMVARRIGEKNPEAAAKAAAQAIILTALISIVISFVGIFFAEDILKAMKAEEKVIEIGVPYTQILLGSNIVIMLLFILNGIFRGAGDASMAMRSLWTANLLNIILDPLLIFGIGPFPELGLTGAAIATMIGRGTGVAFQLYVLFNGKRIIRLAKSYFKPNPETIRKIVDVASTGTGQFLISSASWIFLMRLVAGLEESTVAVSGYGLAIKIIIFTILPAWGIANAAATLLGQNLGAKQPERAEISVWRAAYLNAAFMFLVSIFYFIFAEPLMTIFTTDAEVIRIGAHSLRIFSIGYVFFGVGMTINSSFSGAGDTRTPTVINFVAFWLIQIPLAYLLVEYLNWKIDGILWAVVISEVILTVICVIIFRQGKWKKVQI